MIAGGPLCINVDARDELPQMLGSSSRAYDSLPALRLSPTLTRAYFEATVDSGATELYTRITRSLEPASTRSRLLRRGMSAGSWMVARGSIFVETPARAGAGESEARAIGSATFTYASFTNVRTPPT